MSCPTLIDARQPVTVRRATTPTEYRHAATLLHDYAHWIETATGLDPFTEQPAFRHEVCDLAGVYGGGSGALLMAFEGDVPAATAAVVIDGDRAELKRMYVRPSMRGLGLTPRLLAATTAFARSKGCRTMWLESLSGAMDRAIALYRRFGFVESDRPGTTSVTGMVVMELAL